MALAARGPRGLVTSVAGSSVAILDLSDEGSVLVYQLPVGSGAAGAAFVNDSIAYVANPFSDRATRLNRQRRHGERAVGGAPAVAVTRGGLSRTRPGGACAGPCRACSGRAGVQ